LSQGDTIRIKGGITDFEQTVGSMQIEHQNIETAKKGGSLGFRRVKLRNLPRIARIDTENKN